MESARGLKCLPLTKEDFEKELDVFKNLNRHAELPPRAKLLYNAFSSAQINCPFESAIILMLGDSGVGKSSTINHLLDTGEGVPVAKTSSTESQTRSTSEYVLTFDEPKFEVCDLKLRVVDTPGFNDGDGVDQTACNFVSIKKFFQEHPSLPESVRPNLVFLVVKATDQRIKGRNNLAKCLKGIKLLEVIDAEYPNVVVVLTWCCNVAHKKIDKWVKKMQEKKDIISTLVYEVLGVKPPVVLLDNDFDEHELTKDGEFTLLPNGEMQPKNLYNACLELLEQNQDRFGLMVLNASFTKLKKDQPTNGHVVEATDSSTESLSSEEKKLSQFFSNSAKGGSTSTMECVSKLDETQQQEEHVLETKLGIESASCGAVEVVGQGYNIILDKLVLAQIMTFSVEDTKFGIKLPSCAQITKVSKTKELKMHIQTDEKSIESRLHNLGLNVDLAPSIIELAPKVEANTSSKNDRSRSSTKTTKSSLTEVRIAKVNIGNFETKGISFTKDFVSAIEELPDQCADETGDKQKFDDFFNRFGHCVVTSAYVGGAVEVKTCGESSEMSKHDEGSIDGAAGIDVPGVAGARLSEKIQPSTKNAKTDVLNTTETRWCGGRNDMHNKTILQSEEKMQMWKASVSKEPTLLTTEMSVEPISSVVGVISKTKGKICQQALRNVIRKQQDEEKKKMEDDKKERLRIESNTRIGSIKPPDSEGWWKYFTSFNIGVGTVVIGVIGVAVVILRTIFKR